MYLAMPHSRWKVKGGREEPSGRTTMWSQNKTAASFESFQVARRLVGPRADTSSSANARGQNQCSRRLLSILHLTSATVYSTQEHRNIPQSCRSLSRIILALARHRLQPAARLHPRLGYRRRTRMRSTHFETKTSSEARAAA